MSAFVGDANFRASGLEFLKELPSSRRRELCKDVECSVIVREFADRAQRKSIPAPVDSR